MLYQTVMDLRTVFFLFTLQTFIVAGNQTSSGSECILTDIKSHLSIASQIIETAKGKIPNGNTDTDVGSETSASYECIFTDIKSHLRIASQIIETATQKIPKDLKEVCKEFTGNGCKNVTYNAKPLDCSDLYLRGERRDGLYNIWPQNGTFGDSLQIYCDMESNGGGWTVIQRRGDYGSPEDFFYRDWTAYKIGFGSRMKDFWIGNDNLFALTNQRLYQLRVNITDWHGDSGYALYDEFSISDENEGYKLHVSGYNGTAGDSMMTHNGHKFSTIDRDNDIWSDGHCAVYHKGAWWYAHCRYSSLNGLYLRAENATRDDGVQWWTFKKSHQSLKDSVMMIRPASFTDTSNKIY